MRPGALVSCSLIAVLLCGALPEGIVLCFGADGHVDVTTADHARCHHSHETLQPDQCSDPIHCQPCVDIPFALGEVEFLQTPQPDHAVSKSLIAAHGQGLSQKTVLLDGQAVLPPTAARNPSLASLRSVILLS